MKKEIEEYINTIDNETHRDIMREVLEWVIREFPELDLKIKWKQPMFLHHGTFIIAFSDASKHFSVAPERKGMVTFEDEFKRRGISRTKMLFRFMYHKPIDFDMIHKVISYNIEDKKGYNKFWRV